MSDDFGFIPGFLPALQRSPAALEARNRLNRAIATGLLTRRERALVSLAVAHVSRCDYCIWAQACVGRRVGLSGEDSVFASAGTALDRREAAIVKLAVEIARSGSFAEDEVNQLHHDPVLSKAEVMEVVSNAAFAVINNYLIQSIDPADRVAARKDRAV